MEDERGTAQQTVERKSRFSGKMPVVGRVGKMN
jgi:hypothetical protein